MTDAPDNPRELRSPARSEEADDRPGRLTCLLQAMEQGDPSAFDRLFSMAYQELRIIARNRLMASGAGLTLNPTGLVHETYMKMAASTGSGFHSSRHFFAVAACAMRQIIIDMARRRISAKRGGGQARLEMECDQLAVDDQAAQLCELDHQLERLAETDERLVRVIECRFFAGLSEPETAEALSVSVSTVQRDWIRAKAWFAGNGANERKNNGTGTG
ncbi:MAG: RNA polymerase subunit sigma-70 [Xanthomonadales bacterium]|nr:RNA polymerase subunit sigma-70 [Xanthomonadales bacterium]